MTQVTPANDDDDPTATTRDIEDVERDGGWPGWWYSHHPACRCVFLGSSLPTTNILSLVQAPQVSTRSRPHLGLVLVSSSSLSRPRLSLISSLAPCLSQSRFTFGLVSSLALSHPRSLIPLWSHLPKSDFQPTPGSNVPCLRWCSVGL